MVCGAAATMVTLYAVAVPAVAANSAALQRTAGVLSVRAGARSAAGVIACNDAGGDGELSNMAMRRVPFVLRHRGGVGHAPVVHVGETATTVSSGRRDARGIGERISPFRILTGNAVHRGYGHGVAGA